jgi:outer membrane receptor protein involved in Fe transport
MSSLAIAGDTGKIIGKVVDENKQPLPGVTIIVVGTTRGASTDMDGKYQIIGIPLGTYTIQARSVGFAPLDKKDIRIGADETKQINFELTTGDVKLGPVDVTADQLVNSFKVGSEKTTNENEIKSIPNVKSVEDVLKLQAGVVQQGKALFIRGGRANEVQYLVDGIPTNDVQGNVSSSTTGTNEELQKYYSGVSSGTIGGGSGGLSVSANAIQSVSVQTSGFDADLGNAQSGVVNIVTKSGSDKYSSSLQYRTDRISSSNQNEYYTSFSLGGPEPITKYLLPNMGVNLPGKLTFFFNMDIDRNDGPYTYVNNQFFNPLQRKVQLNGFLGGLLNGFGFRFRDDQHNSFTFNSKIRYDMSSTDQFSYGYRASLTSTHDFSNAWKFRGDSSGLGANLGIQNVLTWTHFFSGNTFLRVNLGKLETDKGNDVAGIKPTDYSAAWQDRDPNGDGFNDLGTDQNWAHSLAKVWSARIDFNSQVHPLHLLKTGFEFYYEELQSTSIARPTVPQPDSTGSLIAPPFPSYFKRDRGEYPGYGVYRWATTAFPNRGSAYLQDNIEFSGLNLHIGLRYDYFDVGRQVYYDDWLTEWKLAYQWDPNLEGQANPDWIEKIGYNKDTSGQVTYRGLADGTRFWYYLTHGYFSPRLSIGYPVTDRIVFYFNYGHFLQFPDRDSYYRDPFGQGPTNNLVGNPSLKPQRSVSYEAGFEDQFSDDMAVALHAFYKDIFDYTTTIPRGNNNFYVNLDYASVRGFEITFNQAFTGNFSTSFSYSYQLAKGRSSDPLASIFNPNFQLPRETRLSYDQNHTANIFTSYKVGPKEPGKFLGLPFVNNYGISLTWSFGSGFPYTPYVPRTTARNVYLVNNETKPYTSTVNLSFYKGILLMDHLNMMVTLDVTNLFNRRNVTDIFSYTGAPYKFGDVGGDGVYGGDVYTIYPYNRADYRLDPTNFDSPRQFILGVKLNWD